MTRLRAVVESGTPSAKMKAVSSPSVSGHAASKPPAGKGKGPSSGLGEIMSLAEQRGLLSGVRTLVIRGRMPEKLVAEAKLKTGIQSDSKLLEAALANIALADDYGEWLLAQRGTVSPDLELDF